MKKHLFILLAATFAFASPQPSSSQLFNEANEILAQYNGQANGLSKAREILQKLTLMGSNSADTLLLKGKLILQDGYISRNDYRKEYLDKAKRICQKVIKSDPQRIEGYLLQASLFMHDKSKDGLHKAKLSLDQAASIDQNSIRLKFSYTQLANKHKRDDEVIRLANEALSLSTKNWQKAYAHSFLASAYWRTKDFERSRASYLKIVELEPTSPWALINYSSFLRKRKDYDGAIAYAKKSLALADYGMGWNVLSKAYYGKGYQLHWKKKDKINSRKWFQLGVDAYPNSLDCHYGLGASYFHTGWVNHSVEDIKRAQKEYEECQRIKPEHKSSLKELKKIEKLLKRVG